MKILLVHNRYANTGGEDQVFFREKAMLEQYLGKDAVFEYTVSVKDFSKWQILRSILFSKFHYQQIFEMVKREQINIVHIHNYFPLLTASIFQAAKDAGAKVIHTVHNFRWWCISGNFYREEVGICKICVEEKKFWNGIRHKCYRKSFWQSLVAKTSFAYYKYIGVFNRIDQFWVLTKFQYNLLLELGIPKEKLMIKPNMSQLGSVINKVNANKKGFLYVGRLEHEKGIELLLSVWKELPATIHLKVIGNGALKQKLMTAYQQSNIDFIGECSFEEVNSHMQASLFTIQPSLWYETMGLTIIESMQNGTPVIGFEIGTRKELIANGKNGLLTSPEGLLETIKAAANMSELDYGILSQNAKNSAICFTPDLIIQKQINLYNQILVESINSYNGK